MAGLVDPTDSSLVRLTKEGPKRALSNSTCKKEPITSDMMKDLVTLYIPDGQFYLANLIHIRTVTMCVLVYAGFLPFSELASICFNHVVFSDDRLNLFILASKTDVYREGRHVLISKIPGSLACPVHITKSYLNLVHEQVHPNQFIFRELSKPTKDINYKTTSLYLIPVLGRSFWKPCVL